jgi:hypothetical protein
MNRTLQWLKHLGLSLLIGLVSGGLGYLIADAITSAYLLYEQQQFFQQATTVLRQGGGISALAQSNLHEMRQHVAEQERHYQHLSIQIGMGFATVAAVFSYLVMEYQTEQG